MKLAFGQHQKTLLAIGTPANLGRQYAVAVQCRDGLLAQIFLSTNNVELSTIQLLNNSSNTTLCRFFLVKIVDLAASVGLSS